MLEYELTKKKTGIILWGDIWSLKNLYELIHRVNDESVLIKNKSGNLLALAYDIRKAFDGFRRKAERTFFSEDSCNIYGVEIILPIFVVQVGALRAAMAFMPTSLSDQSIVFELEAVLESAGNSLREGTGSDLIDCSRRLGEQFSQLEQYLSSRAYYYAKLPTREKSKKLFPILHTLDPVVASMGDVLNRSVGAIPLAEFDTDISDDQWATVEW